VKEGEGGECNRLRAGNPGSETEASRGRKPACQQKPHVAGSLETLVGVLLQACFSGEGAPPGWKGESLGGVLPALRLVQLLPDSQKGGTLVQQCQDCRGLAAFANTRSFRLRTFLGCYAPLGSQDVRGAYIADGGRAMTSHPSICLGAGLSETMDKEVFPASRQAQPRRRATRNPHLDAGRDAPDYREL